METRDTLNPDAQPGDEAPGISTPTDAQPSLPTTLPATEAASVEQIEPEPAPAARPARAVRITLPMTILVGIIMFLLGGVGGYFGRPLISPPPPTPTPAAAAAQQKPADMKGILALLISKTRHFRGSPNAPVTLLEFADFQ